jgi:type I restriction enzyme S subunit
MSDELPQGWASARLEEIVTARKGKKPALLRDTPANGFVSYLDIHAIEKNVVRQFAEVKSSKLAAKDDLFVVWDGARSGWIGGGITGAIGSTIMALTAQQVESAYVRHFIAGQFQNLNTNTRGTGIPHVDPEVFWNLEVPLAPLAEQRRIVAKVETLLSKVDTCQQRLAKIPKLLKRLRQSVLAVACSGRLTADWREENPNASDVNGSEDTPDGFPALPETWRWKELATVCTNVVDCPHSTPKWTESGRLCVRTTNFKPGFLELSEVRYVSNATFNERIERLRPQPGDILYSREGGILGIACIIPPGVELCLGQRMMLFRTKSDFNAAFLMHWLNSRVILRRVQELTGGSASPHLNVRDIKSFPTPVPPFPEQQEIVRRVESLFALADQIEARLKTAASRIGGITPSLLARAFTGKLVPQDPTDEPAEKLLERIKSKKASHAH